MIHIDDAFQQDFSMLQTLADFMAIEMTVVRDFKNRKTGRFEINGKGYYIKKHFAAGHAAVIDEITHLRKPHIGALYEMRALAMLQQLGIPTMTVVAYGVAGCWWASQHSFLVTAEIADEITLEDLCKQWPTRPPSPLFKRRLICEVARIARVMHKAGMNHRDFYICHFMLDIKQGLAAVALEKPRLYLIDLHRAQIRPSVPLRWQVKDIGGLYFSAMDAGLSARDIYRFIRVYTGLPLKEAISQYRHFWSAVTQRAIKLYKKTFNKAPKLVIKP